MDTSRLNTTPGRGNPQLDGLLLLHIVVVGRMHGISNALILFIFFVWISSSAKSSVMRMISNHPNIKRIVMRMTSNHPNTKRIVIAASDVAAIVGRNPFKKPEDVLETMWKKYQFDTFTLKTKDDLGMEALKMDETGRAMEIVNSAILATKKATSSSAVLSNFERAANEIQQHANMSDEHKARAVEFLVRSVDTFKCSSIETNEYPAKKLLYFARNSI